MGLGSLIYYVWILMKYPPAGWGFFQQRQEEDNELPFEDWRQENSMDEESGVVKAPLEDREPK